jgi:hypothetical protein
MPLSKRSLSKRVVATNGAIIIKAPRAWLRKHKMFLKDWRKAGFIVKPLKERER